MGILYETLMKSLNEAVEYEKGNINLPTQTIFKTKVKNKYNLKPSDINKLVILDRSEIDEACWRNNVIEAYVLSKRIGSIKDDFYGTTYEVWIGIYDENAKAYKNKVRYSCTSHDGMCDYKFKSFFNPKEIKNKNELKCQEFLLQTINELINIGILGLPNNE